MAIPHASIWIGYDPREAAAFAVAKYSAKSLMTVGIPIHGVVLSDLRNRGLYTRPTTVRVGVDHPILWDDISNAPMSTEFAVSRFLVPHLARSGWALFMDCDTLVRTNLCRLFEIADPKYAIMCVKHNYEPTDTVKMDGQPQTKYGRKNWSSVMLFNVDHPANKALTVELVNTIPGRDLHRFCWLDDKHIGELGPEWNWLAGISDPAIEPKIVHHTNGSPAMRDFDNVPYADEWRAELDRWAI